MLHGKLLQPLDAVDCRDLQPGLRRWTARNRRAFAAPNPETWASLHHNGSVTLTTALGGHLDQIERELPGGFLDSSQLELLVSNIMGLVKAAGDRLGAAEYELILGLELEKPLELAIGTLDYHGHPYYLPLETFAPIETTVSLQTDMEGFLQQTRELATDCVNQAETTGLRVLRRNMDEPDRVVPDPFEFEGY
jgi:hypothetical protein